MHGAITAVHLNASILLGAAGALLAGALAIADDVGAVSQLLGITLAGAVIWPRLRARATRRTSHALYSSELRRWSGV